MVNAFTHTLESKGLRFSKTKNVACASSGKLNAAVCKQLVGISVGAALRVTSLGTGLGAGTRRNVSQLKKRLRRFRSRLPRFKALRRAGVRTDRLLRTGANAAMMFGCEVMGISDSMLNTQRRTAAAATCERNCGADLDLTLLVADDRSSGAADPAFAAHVGVIQTWALAVWEKWVPQHMLQRLFTKTADRLARTKAMWSRVYGPAAALLATAHRLGWRVESAAVAILDDATKLNFALDSPAYVKGAVVQSVRRWRWRALESKMPHLSSSGLGLGAWWHPVQSALRLPNTDSWNYVHKGALLSAIMGRQWPQQRLFSAGLVDSNLCQLCKERPDGGCLGTLAHRLICPALAAFRRRFMPEWLQDVLATQGSDLTGAQLLQLTRGLVPTPRVERAPPNEHGTFDWHIAPDGPLVASQLFTDGSLMDSALGDICPSLGWGFVALDDCGNVLAAACGVPPPWVTTIQGAELWAIQVAVTSVAFPGTIYTDCQTVQAGFERGPEWMQSARRRYARIWSVIHTGLDQQSQGGAVVWMPAHTKAEMLGTAVCSSGELLTETMQCANEMADLLAKQGAESVRVSDAVRGSLWKHFVEVREVAVFLGQLTAVSCGSSFEGLGGLRDSSAASAGELARLRAVKAAARKPTKGVKNSVAPADGCVQPVDLYRRSGRLSQLRQRILDKAARVG